MNLNTGTKPRSNKSNIPTPIWRSWNLEEDPTLINSSTKKKPKQNVKPVPRSRSNNVVERKRGKGVKMPSKHSDNTPKRSLIDRAASTTSLCFVDNVYIRQRLDMKALGGRVGSAGPTTGLRSELTRKCTLHELRDIPALYDTDPKQAQPSKSWVQAKPHVKPTVSLKYGLFPQPRKVHSPNRISLLSPTRFRGPNTRMWSPVRNYSGLNNQKPNIMREKTRANTERGDRAVKTNVKKEGARAVTKKGSSHYSVVYRAPPPPKLGLSDTMHLDIKPGKGRFVIPPR